METYKQIKSLWHHIPIFSVQKICELTDLSIEDLHDYVLGMRLASLDEWNLRQRFISYCLDGNEHMIRCKACSIRLYDKPNLRNVFIQLNYHGYCPDCFARYKPMKYDNSISWYRNMMNENWKPTNKGWFNQNTGIFLPKDRMKFFIENKVTP